MGASGSPEGSAVVRTVTRVLDKYLAVDEAVISHERYDGSRQTITRLSVERDDSVAIILVDRVARTIWLAEQFRYPTLVKSTGWLRELPAGRINANESPEVAVRREVREELGFSLDVVEHVGTFFLSPGGSSERIVLYYASVSAADRDPRLIGDPEDPTEDIKPIEEQLGPFLDAARLGRINDAKTLIGGLWLVANAERLGLS